MLFFNKTKDTLIQEIAKVLIYYWTVIFNKIHKTQIKVYVYNKFFVNQMF